MSEAVDLIGNELTASEQRLLAVYEELKALCAEDLPPKAPERARLAGLVALGDKVAADQLQPILADDRSDLWDYVISGYRALGEPHHDDPVGERSAAPIFCTNSSSSAPSISLTAQKSRPSSRQWRTSGPNAS